MRHTAIEQRPASPLELKLWRRDISWFEFRRRRLARQEATEGLVEVVRFGVGRAWSGNWCEGAPCCPNEWVIETEDGMVVLVSSWHTLTAVEQRFPGSEVTIVRWPKTLRVVSGTTTGEAITPQPEGGLPMNDLPAAYGECRVSTNAELPESVRTAIHA